MEKHRNFSDAFDAGLFGNLPSQARHFLLTARQINCYDKLWFIGNNRACSPDVKSGSRPKRRDLVGCNKRKLNIILGL